MSWYLHLSGLEFNARVDDDDELLDQVDAWLYSISPGFSPDAWVFENGQVYVTEMRWRGEAVEIQLVAKTGFMSNQVELVWIYAPEYPPAGMARMANKRHVHPNFLRPTELVLEALAS